MFLTRTGPQILWLGRCLSLFRWFCNAETFLNRSSSLRTTSQVRRKINLIFIWLFSERLKVKSLNFAHPEAHAISCKLRSAGEAIKHGFLDEIALVVTKHEGDTEAIEVFSFKILYFEDGSVAAQLNVTQGDDKLSPFQRLGQRPYEGTPAVRDQLIMLARAVHVICHKVLKPLPEVFSANFRISFTSGQFHQFISDSSNVISFKMLLWIIVSKDSLTRPTSMLLTKICKLQLLVNCVPDITEDLSIVLAYSWKTRFMLKLFWSVTETSLPTNWVTLRTLHFTVRSPVKMKHETRARE